MKPRLEEPPEIEQRHDVEVGDEVYVSHRGAHCAAKVVAHGRHGLTGEIDGQHHKITWDKMLGHKARVRKQYKMIEQGEDGVLVEDETGRRRFLAVPNEALGEDDRMVAKSLGGGRVVAIFAKADPKGEALEAQKGDCWTKAGASAAPAQRGQHVGFINGEHKGHGEVVAAGKDGVIVKDGAGGEHRVRHGSVTHHWKGKGKPGAGPHDDHEQRDDKAAGPSIAKGYEKQEARKVE